MGSRVVNKLAVADFVEICSPSVLSPSGYGSCKSFSHCRSQTRNCNIFLGAFQSRNVHKIRNFMSTHSYQILDVTRSDFHTSMSVKNYEEDYQKEEKRNAKILIWMCIFFLVTVGGLYSFIDPEEYDRPTVEKS